MADVRLTATNPADSSVVPVACNEKGELKLEEIPDQSFDGNLQGDLTVSGSASFVGKVAVNDNPNHPDEASLNISGSNADKFIQFYDRVNTTNNSFIYDNGFLTYDGRATFAGEINAGGSWTDNSGSAQNFVSRLSGANAFKFRSNTGAGSIVDFHSQGYDLPSVVAKIMHDGSVTFARNKAGFTAEGNLWCTTRRGDTVMLDVTSNGLASWVPYTPPTRFTELQDKWAEKDGILPVPHESSQDEPETTQ